MDHRRHTRPAVCQTPFQSLETCGCRGRLARSMRNWVCSIFVLKSHIGGNISNNAFILNQHKTLMKRSMSNGFKSNHACTLIVSSIIFNVNHIYIYKMLRGSILMCISLLRLSQLIVSIFYHFIEQWAIGPLFLLSSYKEDYNFLHYIFSQSRQVHSNWKGVTVNAYAPKGWFHIFCHEKHHWMLYFPSKQRPRLYSHSWLHFSLRTFHTIKTSNWCIYKY